MCHLFYKYKEKNVHVRTTFQSGNKFVAPPRLNWRLLPRSSSRRKTVFQRLPATGGASRLHAVSIPPVAGRESEGGWGSRGPKKSKINK